MKSRGEKWVWTEPLPAQSLQVSGVLTLQTALLHSSHPWAQVSIHRRSCKPQLYAILGTPPPTQIGFVFGVLALEKLPVEVSILPAEHGKRGPGTEGWMPEYRHLWDGILDFPDGG